LKLTFCVYQRVEVLSAGALGVGGLGFGSIYLLSTFLFTSQSLNATLKSYAGTVSFLDI